MAQSSVVLEEKFRKPPAGEVMITVFWDFEGVILVDGMLTGQTINSDSCVRMLV
jgi:hypothetical protein